MSVAWGSWFRGIKGKLLFAAVLPVIGFGVVYGVSHSNFLQLGELLGRANNEVIPIMDVIGEMRQGRNKAGYQLLAAMIAQSPEDRAEKIKISRLGVDEFEEGYKAYISFQVPSELEPVVSEARITYSEYIKDFRQAISLAETGKVEDIEAAKALLFGRLGQEAVIIKKMTDASRVYYRELARKNAETGSEAIARTNKIIILTTVLACLGIFASLIFIAIRITSAIDRVGYQLITSTEGVTSSVGHLSQAGNNLSQSSTEAAASLEETVASLEELTSMVKMNSDNAKQAAALSSSSKEAAEKGELEIQNLIHSMTDISRSSKKIEEIISVIDDIAFQTNLLALNAAVEAARAGEQGKGFAVVAEAVRALAQRSASAAKDITSLIKESVSQIEQGSRTADQSGTVLTNIVNSVKKVADLNNEIAAASSEQTSGIQQISKAMNQLDQASQSNAASAEEIAATSGEINSLAQTTHDLVLELKNVVQGSEKSSPSSGDASRSKMHQQREVVVKKSNVVAFKKSKVEASSPAQTVIPFDEEDGRSVVGSTEGF